MDYVTGEVLVKFKGGDSASLRMPTGDLPGAVALEPLPVPDVAIVRLAPGVSVEEAVSAYGSVPGVAHAQPNFLYELDAVPDDPIYPNLWGLKNDGQKTPNSFRQPAGETVYAKNNPGTAGDDINVEAAWNAITDCSSVTVAVIDSGVAYGHEDLAENMWESAEFPKHGYNFLTNTDDPRDYSGHGTHVAGTIGAVGNNGKGVTGVCWKASIMALRVFPAVGKTNTGRIISAIKFAVKHEADVINMSLSGSGAFDQLYYDGIKEAQLSDVVVVVAAGNNKRDNDSNRRWPCNFDLPNLICVAALDQSFELANFSNWGLTKVMLGAPGTAIVSTWPGTVSRDSGSMTTGWEFSTSPLGTSGGWVYTDIWNGRKSIPGISNPDTFPEGTYASNTDDRAWMGFDAQASDTLVASYFYKGEVLNMDYFRTAYRTGFEPLDPFGEGGDKLSEKTYFKQASWNFEQFDVTPCQNTVCSFGFQLASSGGVTSKGLAIAEVRLDALRFNRISYNTIQGTSMATPIVVGVVAMLRAYNPDYGYAEVVAAIKAGGRSVPSLQGKTITGKVVDAIGTISYLAPPPSVTVVVQ